MRLEEVSYHDDCGVVDAMYQEAECLALDDRDTIPCPASWVPDGSVGLLDSEERHIDDLGRQVVMRVDAKTDEPLSVYLDREWPLRRA